MKIILMYNYLFSLLLISINIFHIHLLSVLPFNLAPHVKILTLPFACGHNNSMYQPIELFPWKCFTKQFGCIVFVCIFVIVIDISSNSGSRNFF